MEYIVPMLLTFIASLAIIKILENRGWKKFNNFMYSQSAMHNRIRSFMPPEIIKKEKILSQSDKHISKNMIKVVIISGKAYWISDNSLYVAEVDNGNIVSETAQQINTDEMSTEELDKVLRIVDNLNDVEE